MCDRTATSRPTAMCSTVRAINDACSPGPTASRMPVSTRPDPVDLGFPEKFKRFYADQIRAIDMTISNPKTLYVALAMPTGSGKASR